MDKDCGNVDPEILDRICGELRAQAWVLERDLGNCPSDYEKGLWKGVVLAHQLVSSMSDWEHRKYKYYALRGNKMVEK